MPTVWGEWRSVAFFSRAAGLPRVPRADLDSRGDEPSSDAESVAELVLGRVGDDESEVGDQCIGPPAGSRAQELPDRMGLAPQVPACDGAAGT